MPAVALVGVAMTPFGRHPDATIGDLKASLDKLRIPDKEQKELLAIIESTRPQIVTER